MTCLCDLEDKGPVKFSAKGTYDPASSHKTAISNNFKMPALLLNQNPLSG